MIFSLLSKYIEASGAAGLLWVYLVLHLCIGWLLPYRAGAKPFFFLCMENIGVDLERRLNRENRPRRARFARGVVVAAVMGALGAAVGSAICYVSKMPYGWAAEIFLLALCISFMMPLKVVQRVIRHLQKNELPQAAGALQSYVQEPLDRADAHTVIRRTIEFIAVSLNRFLVAPAFWFLLTGPLGLAIYMTYSALHQSFGLLDERHRAFGACVRVVDHVLNVLPALVTAVLLSVSALFVSKSNPLRALGELFRYRPAYAMIAAAAGGLGITLGGPIRYSADYTEDRPWIGPKGSSARLPLADLLRAAMLQYVSFIWVIGLQSALIILKI